jgi:hypothetical protein
MDDFELSLSVNENMFEIAIFAMSLGMAVIGFGLCWIAVEIRDLRRMLTDK